MNKFFTKVATFSVGLLMAIGVGVGIGANKGASEARAADGAPITGFTQATSVDDINNHDGGDFLIAAVTSSSTIFLPSDKTSSSKFSGTESDSLTDVTNFTFVISSEGNNQYSIRGTSKYYGYSSSTNINVYDSVTNNSKWTFSIVNTRFRITNVNTTGRGIVYRAGSTNQFGGYATSNINNTEYYDCEIYYKNSTGFTVTYNPGTGSGSNYQDTGKSGDYNLLNYTDSKLNYSAPNTYSTFGGWSVVIGTASAVTKAAGAQISVTAATTATAIWNDSRSDLALSATAGSSSVNVGSTLSLTITATSSGNPVSNLSYTCTSSSDSIATVTNVGVITGVAGGNATITINFAGDSTYKPASTTFDVTVKVPFPSSGEAIISTIDAAGSGSGYAAYDGSHSTTITGGTVSITWTSSNVMPSTGLQFKKSGGYIYNTTDLGNIISVVPSDSRLTIYYGTSEHPTSGTTVGTGNGYFTVINETSSAISGASITITWGTPVTLDSISAKLDTTASEKTWHVNDPLTAAEVDVTPSYSDSSGATVEDGTGVYFNPALTEDTYTFASTGDVEVPVYYQDANGRTANTTFTVEDVQPAKTVQAWSITGEIGDTTKSTAYDLSGLTLHAWYDTQKTDEAPSSIAALYELSADPATAGSSPDPDNVIDVKVLLKSDSSLVYTFEDVSAPIINSAPGTVDNPYTVLQARTIAAALPSGSTGTDLVYIKGRVSALADESYSSEYGNKTFWLTPTGEDDENSELEIWRAYYTDAKTKMTEEQFNSIDIGDEMIICGYLKNYNGTLETEQKAYVYSHTQETRAINLSLASDSLTLGSSFQYNGTVSTAYTIRSNSDVTSSVTYSGYDMSTTGNQTVTVAYHDPLWNMDITETYTLTVSYASVTSVSLTEHEINIGVVGSHKFSASLNQYTDPSNVISWSVENDINSSIPTDEFEIDSTGELTIATETSGRLIVTASCSGHSDTCLVIVTGDPYATFNKTSVEGIVGAPLNNTITATANNLAGSPTSYTWSIKSGEATDIIEFTNGSATTTLSFSKPGSTVLHVVISDGSAKPAEGDIEVNVIKSLNTTKIPGVVVEHSETIDLTAQGFSNAEDVSDNDITGTNFKVVFAKGTSGAAPTYYSNNVTVPAVRAYGGNTLTVSSTTKTLTKIEFTFGTGNGTNTITANSGTYSDGVWTGSASSVTFDISTVKSNQKRFAEIKAYWETAGEDVTVSNINYNAQKAVIEFAEDLTSKLNAVCDQDTGNTPLDGNDGLIKKWEAIEDVYNEKRNSLSTEAEQGQLSERDIFDALIANASKSESGDSLQKALSSYDYVYGKYHASLDGEVQGSADFLHNTSGRGVVATSVKVNPLTTIFNSENSSATAIIVIVSMISLAALGGYFYLRKRKED